MENFLYRVSETETLLSIAEKFGVSPFSIIDENNLKSEVSAGDLLVVRKCGCRCYKVKPFDTIENVCARLCVSEEDLKKANGNLPYLFCGMLLKY